MRFVIQRVQHAEVKVDGEVTGSIGKGFLVLIGVAGNRYQRDCRQNDQEASGAADL